MTVPSDDTASPKTAHPRFRVRFNREDNGLAHRMIGALFDMTLAAHDVPLETLETVFVGLGEVIEAVAVASGAVVAAELADAETGVVRLHHTAQTVTLPPGAIDIVEAAFPAFSQESGVIELAPHIGRSDGV